MCIRRNFIEIAPFIAVIYIALSPCAYADEDKTSLDFDSEADLVLEETESTGDGTEETESTGDDLEDAESEEGFVFDLEEDQTVVSPSKRPQSLSDSSASVYLITAKDIAIHGWQNLAEVLRHIPGIQVQTAESHFQAVSIHGLLNSSASGTRILWFLDDIPINDVHNGNVFIDNSFPVDIISRIEIITEPSSALYGPGAFQGSIHIYTKKPSELSQYGQYRFNVQNNLTFQGSATAGYDNPDIKFGILGHVSGGTTQGDGLIADAVYQTYLMEQARESVTDGNLPTNIRREDIQNNSQKSWYSIFLTMNYDNFSLKLSFRDIYSHVAGSEIRPFMFYGKLSDYPENQSSFNQSGVLSDTVQAEIASRFDRRMLLSSLSYHQNFTDWFLFNTQLSYHLIQYQHKDYDGNTDENFGSLEHQIDYLADFHFDLYDSNTLSTGIAIRYQTIAADDLGLSKNDSINPDDRQTHDLLTPSIWLRDEQRFWSDRIILSAAARYDAFQVIHHLKHDITWEAGFTAKWHPVFTTRLHYSYALNEPSFYRLYSNRIDYTGDPDDLDNEKIHHVNLALDFLPAEWLQFSVSGYYSYIRDLILNDLNVTLNDLDVTLNDLDVPFSYYPVQNTNANIYGAEFKFNIVPNDDWNVYGYYHFLYSVRKDKNIPSDIITDNRFTDDSMHRAEVGFSYHNTYISTDLALFLVSGTPSTVSAYNAFKQESFWRPKYSIPSYLIVQPSLLVKLPADFGLSIHGSYAMSKGMTDSPTYRYYYQREGVPENRYSLSFSVLYPCE